MSILGSLGQLYMFVLLVLLFLGSGLALWGFIGFITSRGSSKKPGQTVMKNNNRSMNKNLGGFIMANNGWFKLAVFSFIGILVSMAVLGLISNSSLGGYNAQMQQQAMQQNNMANMNMQGVNMQGGMSTQGNMNMNGNMQMGNMQGNMPMNGMNMPMQGNMPMNGMNMPMQSNMPMNGMGMPNEMQMMQMMNQMQQQMMMMQQQINMMQNSMPQSGGSMSGGSGSMSGGSGGGMGMM